MTTWFLLFFFLSSAQVAGQTFETRETLTGAPRCRPPRWQGSDSGSPFAGPDRFPESLPAPQV